MPELDLAIAINWVTNVSLLHHGLDRICTCMGLIKEQKHGIWKLTLINWKIYNYAKNIEQAKMSSKWKFLQEAKLSLMQRGSILKQWN